MSDPRRPSPGQPPKLDGAAGKRLVIAISSATRKAALATEAFDLGLSLSDYVERVLFGLDSRERLELALMVQRPARQETSKP